MEIVFGKGKVDTVGAAVNPHDIVHVLLDFGTNNDTHLKNPNYRGLRAKRPTGLTYDNFI